MRRSLGKAMAPLLGHAAADSWSLHDTPCLGMPTPAWTSGHISSTEPGHLLTPAPHSLDNCSHQPHTPTYTGCFSLPPFRPFHCGPLAPQYPLQPSVTLSRYQFANRIFDISSLTLNLQSVSFSVCNQDIQEYA